MNARWLILWSLCCTAAAHCNRSDLPPSTGAESSPPSDPAAAALINRLAARVKAAPEDAGALVDLCLAYEANQLWRQAVDCYPRALRLQPENADLSLHLAAVTHSAGRPEESYQLLKQSAKRHPESAPLQHRLAEALLERGELSPAEAAFRRLIQLRPNSPQGHAGVGAVLLQRGKHQEAIAFLQSAIRVRPDYGPAHYLLGTAYRRAGRLEDAERELARGVGPGVSFLPDSLTPRLDQFRINAADRMAQAAEELNRGRPAQAAAILEQTVQTQPRNATALNNLAAAYLQLGRLEAAEEVLQKARGIDPNKFSTYLNLASLARRRGRFQEALQWAAEAADRAPGLSQPHYARAQALAELGRFEPALSAVQQAVAIDSNRPENFTFAGDLCLQLERYEAARTHFRRALDIEPRFLPARLGLVRANWSLGLRQEARAMLAEARRQAPRHPRVLEWSRRLEGEAR